MENEPLSNETNGTENTALSLRIPLLSYIKELAFSVVVFIAFLLVAWILHRLGNTLGIAWLRFSWRLFEVLVMAFGTLLCVLFFLKASSKFSQKLIRHLQKTSKQTGGLPSRLQTRDIAKSFVEPLHKKQHVLFVCSVLTIIAFLFVGISFAGLVQSNCNDMSVLAGALICETGPDFIKQVNPNYLRDILESYTKYIENKHLSVLLKIFPNYNPKEVFAEVNEILEKAKSTQEQEEVAHDIWRAGEEVMLFRLKVPKLLPRRIALHDYREAIESLVPLAEEALADSNEAAEQFNNKPTMENAVHSCERNRLTMLLLFPLWSSHDRPEVASLFTHFRTILEDCRDGKKNVAKRIQYPNDPRIEFLEEIIAKSEQRRIDIIDDIKAGNIQEAIEHIWDSVEDAYNRRAKLLELCAKIRNAENYSEEIKEIIP
ncbi:MAG TPA: hypothetical protein DIU00_05395 [Phycisphaerales bacterium]|nr:hypothetical protein [Phycisphaerales bacterium]